MPTDGDEIIEDFTLDDDDVENNEGDGDGYVDNEHGTEESVHSELNSDDFSGH